MLRKGLIVLAIAALVSHLWIDPAAGRKVDAGLIGKLKRLQQAMVLDGSAVHNVGNLHMNVTNWGVFGSYPSSTLQMAESPSAQWPANSGVEYLYVGGLWVGAKKGGIPVVSTAAYENEFRPTIDDLDVIYRTFEGADGGARYPSPPDDDKDGMANEDWLNGRDDDGDGKIDEDFAAIGKQMFACWFTDDEPFSIQVFPEHTPLHILVRQESYQWEEEQFYNFVGVEYKIRNYGREVIDDLYVGFFADGDAGPRTREQYWLDDGTSLWQGIVCARKGEREVPIRIAVAYFYDVDGDDGLTPGYFGVVFLGHDTDPLGEDAPRLVGLTSYQNFSGDQPYDSGGDPTNDFERYELMSKGGKDKPGDLARDYRMLLATGPFRSLPPDSTMLLQIAFVAGKGIEGMLKAAASAASTYDGNWFDVDGNPETGKDGRETPVYGPVEAIEPDSCDGQQELKSAMKGDIVWINADCREEKALYDDQTCAKGEATQEDFKTGMDGKETQVKWLVGSAPPPPNMRIIPGNHKITLLWDNFSEVTPDISTREFDFEGYRVWRADGWDRPLGTTLLSGPSRDLWQLVEERDLINGVPPDIDFKKPFPRGWQYEPLDYLGQEEKRKLIKMFEESVYYFPLDTVPCPPGLQDLQCDTIEALARYKRGFEGGLQYYKYVDRTVHNGMNYFYSVTAYDHLIVDKKPVKPNYYGDPSSNFYFTIPESNAQPVETYEEKQVYVVPNPATSESLEPSRLEPNQDDPTGIRLEFRNLPRCRSTVRIFTVSGDLVHILYHDGSNGNGTLPWDLVSRNGQDVTSGVYLFSVEPEKKDFQTAIGKFVVIR